MLIWNEEVCYLFSSSETDNHNLWEMNILIPSQGIQIVLWYLFNDNFNALSNVFSIRNIFSYLELTSWKIITRIQYAHLPSINVTFDFFFLKKQ